MADIAIGDRSARLYAVGPPTSRPNDRFRETFMTAKTTEKTLSHSKQPFSIAGRTIAPGQRLQFNLPAAQLYTHTPLEMPIEVINGRRPGPTLLICAAIHGDELNGIEIIRRLRQLKSLDRLRGTLVLAPIVNLFGFIHQSRYLPDRRDLNRCFPGSEAGSIASRMAYLFFNEVVRHCTHGIDLHTGAVHRDNLPQIRAALDSPGVPELAQGFSIPVIVNSGEIERSLRREANVVGIPIITYEAGEALRLDEHCIVTGVRGITSVMRRLNMLPSRGKSREKSEPFVARSTSWLRATSDGMFRTLVELGARVRAGDTLGVISSPVASEESLVTAPQDGIVICVHRLPLVNQGDAVFHIARFGEPGAVEEEITALSSEVQSDPLYEPDPSDTLV